MENQEHKTETAERGLGAAPLLGAKKTPVVWMMFGLALSVCGAALADCEIPRTGWTCVSFGAMTFFMGMYRYDP